LIGHGPGNYWADSKAPQHPARQETIPPTSGGVGKVRNESSEFRAIYRPSIMEGGSPFSQL
jgi:hypothetical protein